MADRPSEAGRGCPRAPAPDFGTLPPTPSPVSAFGRSSPTGPCSLKSLHRSDFRALASLSPTGRGIRGAVPKQTPVHSSPPRGEGGPSGADEGLRAAPQGKSLRWRDLRREGHERYARMARTRKKPKLIPTPITPYYSPLISRVEMGLQRSTARRQSGGLCIVNGGWVRGWEIPVRAGPRKPPAGNPDAPGRIASRF